MVAHPGLSLVLSALCSCGVQEGEAVGSLACPAGIGLESNVPLLPCPSTLGGAPPCCAALFPSRDTLGWLSPEAFECVAASIGLPHGETGYSTVYDYTVPAVSVTAFSETTCDTASEVGEVWGCSVLLDPFYAVFLGESQRVWTINYG